jgi:hypothetical protein
MNRHQCKHTKFKDATSISCLAPVFRDRSLIYIGLRVIHPILNNTVYTQVTKSARLALHANATVELKIRNQQRTPSMSENTGTDTFNLKRQI